MIWHPPYQNEQKDIKASLEIVFTDIVMPVARTKFLMHIEKHYNVRSQWLSIDKLHIQEQNQQITVA